MSRRLVLTLPFFLLWVVSIRPAVAQVPEPADDETVSDDAEVQGPTEDSEMPKDGYLLDPTVTGTSAPAPPWPTPCTMPAASDPTRTLRGQRFNDAAGSQIRERAAGLREETFEHFLHSSRPMALPVTRSAVVVVGRVMSGSSFVSPDKTTAYTEYGVKVESVLAPNATRAIAANETITAQAQGGLLLFPDRRLQWSSRLHRLDIPKRLGRYVLFLQWDSQTDTFQILTGYRLQGGHVVETLSPNFRKFVGYRGDAFLSTVRTAIAKRVDQ